MSIGFKSLKKRADFLKLRENCSSFKTENFIFNFKIDKSVPVPVVGITVSNKIGNAVKRNYIKRLIRSIISNKKSTIPKSLIIEIIAKKNVRPSFSSFNKDILTIELIENPISGAPGYVIENVYVMAGVPTIFQSMLKTVLPNLKKGSPTLSLSVKLYKGEGDIAMQLEQIVKAFSELNFGSYPFNENGNYGTNIVIRGKDKKLMVKAEEKVLTLA